MNRCVPNYVELLQADWRSRPEQWNQVVQLAARLGAIINTGDFKAFARPAGNNSG